MSCKKAPDTGGHAPALKLMSSVLSCASMNCRADADLKLLGSRKLPREAFKGKVVWITGASQVCPVPELLSTLTLHSREQACAIKGQYQVLQLVKHAWARRGWGRSWQSALLAMALSSSYQRGTESAWRCVHT